MKYLQAVFLSVFVAIASGNPQQVIQDTPHQVTSVNTQQVNRATQKLGNQGPYKQQGPVVDNDNSTRIVFPSEDTNKNRVATHNRQPADDKIICRANEWLYPGDNEGDWVCDCKPGFLHYPADGNCYGSHSQGPCQNNQILILRNRTRSAIPECVENDCGQGNVLFNSNCHSLNSENGCVSFSKLLARKILLVADPTTLGLVCADENFDYECSFKTNCCKSKQPQVEEICISAKRTQNEINNG